MLSPGHDFLEFVLFELLHSGFDLFLVLKVGHNFFPHLLRVFAHDDGAGVAVVMQPSGCLLDPIFFLVDFFS